RPAVWMKRMTLARFDASWPMIRDLNVNSDRIIGQLASNRANVIRFIQTAGRTAAAPAAPRDDPSADFARPDHRPAQLGPTAVSLRKTAIQSTPLLRDLHGAAPGLNTLALNLPSFNRATEKSVRALGQASVPGRKFVNQGTDELQALRRAGTSAQPV